MERLQFSTTQDGLAIQIPFAKGGINAEKRTVSGFATIEIADEEADVVTNEATIEAWKNWRGNVREQHGKIAAGKVLDYHPEEYIDDNGKVHNGIWASVYISKGAPLTWEKVLDKTLTGFSIGGTIEECHTQYVPDEDRTVRYITKYRMIELSLVDSPMNQHCNILSVQKSIDGESELTGLAIDTTIDNVFWCDTDRIAVAAHVDLRKCSLCQEDMENIGWFEPTEDSNTKDLIQKVLQDNNKLEKKFAATKGGSTMPEEVKAVEEENLENVAKADEPDLATITKALGEIKDSLSASNQENREQTVLEIQKAVASVKEDVDGKLAALLEKHTVLEQEVKSFKENLGAVEKSLSGLYGVMEKASAVKKSTDVEDDKSLEKANKESFWSNRFLPTTYDQ